MLRILDGDIFESGAEALVNPVNCVGVMGKGLARAFDERFPSYGLVYRELCRDGLISPGRPHVHLNLEPAPRYIVSFPTKGHWRDRSDLLDIKVGLASMSHKVNRLGLGSIAMPALGCGLGELRWDDVLPLLRDFAEFVEDTEVSAYIPR